MNWVGDTPFKELGMDEDKLLLLKEFAEDSEYWKKASSFIHQIVGVKLSSLSDKQKNWLSDIVATLSVELNRRTAKELFGPTGRMLTGDEIKSVIKGNAI